MKFQCKKFQKEVAQFLKYKSQSNKDKSADKVSELSAKVSEIDFDELEEQFLALVTDHLEDDEQWLVNSGATKHLASKSHVFSSIQPCHSTVVKMADGNLARSQGKGRVHIDLDSSSSFQVDDVLHVPDLLVNLLSVSQIYKQLGFSVLFAGGQVYICKQNPLDLVDSNLLGIVAQGHMNKDGLYVLHGKTSHQANTVAASLVPDPSYSTSESLWHARYGHIGLSPLVVASKLKMVQGLPLLKNQELQCHACRLGKQVQAPFPKQAMFRASQPLELIHTDICYMPLESLAGSSEMVQTQLSLPIKALRTDNAKEYLSTEFEAYLQEKGIHRELIVPYAHSQNGVAERKHRTFLNLARSMLKHKNLPPSFWAEAVLTACYISNRAPTKALSLKTPFESLYHVKPDISHFRVFGCLGYASIPKEILQKKGKLADRACQVIVIGYTPNMKAWRCYDPHTKTVFASRSMQFFEEKHYDFQFPQPVDYDTVVINLLDINSVSQSSSDSSSTVSVPMSTTLSSTPLSSTSLSFTPSDSSSLLSTDPYAAYEPLDLHEISDSSSSDLPLTLPQLNQIDELQYPASDPTALCNFALMTTVLKDRDPIFYNQAAKSDHWIRAMQEELEMMSKQDTWDLVPRPSGKNVIGAKWVYRTKYRSDGTISRHKARLVAKGYTQQEGFDYNDVFSPVVRLDTLRAILALAAQSSWPVHQLDFKSAFLNGDLEEELYMQQPPGFVSTEFPDYVCRLKKSIYGLKQAPRCWNHKINGYLEKLGYSRSRADPSLYFQFQGTNVSVILLYVDDTIITGSAFDLIQQTKKLISSDFEVTDLGPMHYCLGLEVWQTPQGIHLTQQKYVTEILDKFHMTDAKPTEVPWDPGHKLSLQSDEEDTDPTLYRQLVGALLYLTITRPDIVYSVGVLTRFMTHPKVSHWKAAKQVLRYLRGTQTEGLFYGRVSNPQLKIYSDSDMASTDLISRKSLTGFVSFFGNSPITWSSRSQSTVSISTTEAELKALTATTQELKWLIHLFEDLKIPVQPAHLYCDNSGAISHVKDLKMHLQIKHLDIKLCFIREQLQQGYLVLHHCPTQGQIADGFTKALSGRHFNNLKSCLHLQPYSSEGG